MAGCHTCSSVNVASCTVCNNDYPYSFNGICIKSCKDEAIGTTDPVIYEPNYTDYTCQEKEYNDPVKILAGFAACTGFGGNNTSHANLKVKIMPLGYSRAIPKSALTYFVMDINNHRGTLTNYTWT
jgi:hypothetical protein